MFQVRTIFNTQKVQVSSTQEWLQFTSILANKFVNTSILFVLFRFGFVSTTFKVIILTIVISSLFLLKVNGRTRFGRKTLLTYLPRSVTRQINLE